ncbi:NAD(P)-dependent oxidoreductase [Solimonas marina]|uniref:NAD(P)-dependent oxidoreductase n=1 Tax=Solimonas marina TaxID=2714601 RepID=A0A970B8B2_9GAMM|nr:NAD(P)-dependent oxidoreductase [Solimonas marina]NKF24560.1 NAD(P)-dependent oxidoreductase [Solimonas marina]
MNIGFIGLGGMGRGIAANLLRAGHRVQVWNRSPGPVDELVALGAERAAGVIDVLQNDVLFSILADDLALRSVLLDGEPLRSAKAGLIHINLATVSVRFAAELAALHASLGQGYVAAPVFGRVDVAAAGKLNIIAAGATATLDTVQPLLDVIGQKTWRVGDEPTRANAVKIGGNFMIAAAIEAMAEASTLADAHGVEPAQFLEILTSTLFAAPVYQGYGKLIAEQRYAPAGFALRLGLKDVRLALEAGDASNVPMPFASVLRDGFLDAVAQGDGDLDWGALAKVAARRANR